jgi:hypothetical protein
MDNLSDEVAILKAQLAVQQMLLRVLVHTHPNPAQVLDTWRRLRKDRSATASTLPADVRSSEWLSQHVQAFAEDWTAELVDVVTYLSQEAGQSHDPDVATP